MTSISKAALFITSAVMLCVCGSSENSSDGENADGTLKVGDAGQSGTVLTQDNSDACTKLCDQMTACDPKEADGCHADCALLAVSIRQEVFDGAIACITAQNCDTMDADSCLAKAGDSVSEEAVSDLVDGICDKMISCDDTMEKAACVSEVVEQKMLEPYKVQNDDVLTCAGACLTSKSCAEMGTDGDKLINDCFVECGAVTGVEDSGATDGTRCRDIAGDWAANYVSCSGESLALDGIQIIETINDDCSMEMRVDNGGCTITYEGQYRNLEQGAGQLSIQHSCGQCSADQCSPSENQINEFDVSREMDGGDLLLNYMVNQAVVDANMSPCAEGSQNLTIFARQ